MARTSMRSAMSAVEVLGIFVQTLLTSKSANRTRISKFPSRSLKLTHLSVSSCCPLAIVMVTGCREGWMHTKNELQALDQAPEWLMAAA